MSKTLKDFLHHIPSDLEFTAEVTSPSMEPLFYPGDLVICKRTPFHSLAEKDIIVYNNSDFKNLIVHRIIKKQKKGKKIVFVTKGDNSPLPDPKHVSEKEYCGKVIRKKTKTLIKKISQFFKLFE